MQIEAVTLSHRLNIQQNEPTMTISIIIPTLNEAETIARTLDFLKKNRDHRLSETLVIDAESTDATAQIAREKGATVYSFPQKSRAAQMNFGAKMATADLLYFVHADTLPPATFLDDIEKAISEGSKMGCFAYKFDSKSILLAINAWFTRFPMEWCQGGDKTFFIEKKEFNALGGYCEKHVIMEEYDFFRRAKKAGHRVKIIPHFAIVSARKYIKNSYVRVNLANLTVLNLWRFGIEPERLRHIYKRLLN